MHWLPHPPCRPHLPVALLIGWLAACGPAAGQVCADYIILGDSDGLALDQPRVVVGVFDGTTASLGPAAANQFLLDTAAERILAVGNAASELLGNGLVVEGTFKEQGISGFTVMDVSAEYRFEYAGTDFTTHALDPSRFLVNSSLDFGSFGGIVGMPGMVGKVVTLDFTPWSGGGIGFMGTEFPAALPAGAGHRYSFDLRPVGFPLPDGTSPPLADDEPIPFITVVAGHGGTRVTGDYAFDTGAQVSIISLATAIAAGLDANGNGSVEDEALDFLPVGGIGGEILAPVLVLDEIRLPTNETVELVWTNVTVLVLDIDPRIDGVFGSDLLTSGWLDAVLFGGDDGFLQQVHLDFGGYPAGNGTGHLDLTPANDIVQVVDRSDTDGDCVPDCWEEFFYEGLATAGGADTDRDGLSLFMEYAHGLDPTVADRAPVTAERGANGAAVISYLRNTGAPELTYQLRVSLQGGSWQDFPGPETSTPAGLGIERVSIVVPSPTTPSVVRLEVSKP